jgi:hypothetical protein
VEYGWEHLACHALIEPPQPLIYTEEHVALMPSESVAEVLEEIVPVAVRGKETNAMIPFPTLTECADAWTGFKGHKLTIGLDLSDHWSCYCVLDEARKIILEPLLKEIESLNERIQEYEVRMEKIAKESYPQVEPLKQVKGG